MPQLDFLQAADFTFARIALRLREPWFYQPAAQRDFGEPKFYELARRRGFCFKRPGFANWRRERGFCRAWFWAGCAARFSNCDFISRRRGMILRVMDFADCGLTSRGFAFVRRILILSRDAVWRACCVRRIVDYLPHRLRAAALFESI